MTAVKGLMSKYGANVPVNIDQPGDYSLPGYSAMYTGYIQSGSSSLAAAYEAAIDIEQMSSDQISELLNDPHISTPEVRRILNSELSLCEKHLDTFRNRLATESAAR